MDRSLFEFPWDVHHTFPHHHKSPITTVSERQKHLRQKQEFKQSSTNLLIRNFNERFVIRETGRFNLDRIDDRPKEWQRDLDMMQQCREKTRKVISDLRRKTRLSEACAIHGQAALQAKKATPVLATTVHSHTEAEDKIKMVFKDEPKIRKKKKDIRSPYSKHCVAAPKKLHINNALRTVKGHAESPLAKCTCPWDSIPRKVPKKEKKKITPGDLCFAKGTSIPRKTNRACSPDPRVRGRALTPSPPQARPRSCRVDIVDGVPGLEGLSSQIVRHLPTNYRPDAVMISRPALHWKRSIAEALKVENLKEDEDFWRKTMPSGYDELLASVDLNRTSLDRLQQQVWGDAAMSSEATNDLAYQRRQSVCNIKEMGTVPVGGVLGRLTDYTDRYGHMQDGSQYDRDQLAEQLEKDRKAGVAIVLDDMGSDWRRPRQQMHTYTCDSTLLEKNVWRKWESSFKRIDRLVHKPETINRKLIDDILEIYPFPENAVCPRRGKEHIFEGAAFRYVMDMEMKLNILDSLLDDPPDQEPDLVELMTSLEKFRPESFVVKLV